MLREAPRQWRKGQAAHARVRTAVLEPSSLLCLRNTLSHQPLPCLLQSVEDLVACGRDLNPDIQDFDDSCFTGGLGRGRASLQGSGRGSIDFDMSVLGGQASRQANEPSGCPCSKGPAGAALAAAPPTSRHLFPAPPATQASM